jgi:hypothetical protein
MTRNILFLTVILLGCGSVLSAQTISGTAVDTKMDKPLSNAAVMIGGTGAYSDESGYYLQSSPYLMAPTWKMQQRIQFWKLWKDRREFLNNRSITIKKHLLRGLRDF